MSKRTTITLDDDVAAKLDEEMRRAGESYRATVNRVLRRGLNPPRRPAGAKPYKVRARNLGWRDDLDFDNIEELLTQVEGPFRK